MQREEDERGIFTLGEAKELEMKGGQSKAEATSTDQRLKTRGRKKKTATKDPNKPKRPPSAFFVFLDDFRREFKEANPNNKSVAAVSEVPQSQICKFEINNNNNNLCAKQHQVGKAAGAKWKSMSEEEKAPYATKAETRKSEYNKSMQEYNMKLANGTSRGEDDESKSEVDEAGGASEEEEEDDD
ncbi:hypothetical protein IGI04_025758 [Brassica rapa subsp. trilocularis]|uniref:HMG box domain-containing protein n=1 Tax=Brassica rapa subsp. trilocularis TaxID=1813537 RepID=A0ABQ7KXY4_BRACM|nr:hypothetical protein IGI04_025758 [Brassica rapa subsp. trilocularis]